MTYGRAVANKTILLACMILLASAEISHLAGKDHVSGRLVVQTRRNADSGLVLRTLGLHGAGVLKKHQNTNVWVLAVPEPMIGAVSTSLEKTGLFTFVERDYVARKAATPNDPSFASQWHLSKIQAPGAWDISTGSTGITIAMIDSGADPNHPDLASRLVPGWNFLTGTSNTADAYGHGTQTAGVAGAATNNLTGIAGVTWNNPIMPLLVLNLDGNAYYSDIANAITYAADHGARIISISIIGVTPSSLLQDAVNYAWNKGAVVFAGAGNLGADVPAYPAACDNVVAVNATDSNDNLASWSSYGNWVDLSAPGASILTSMAGGGYGYVDGTSFSTPVAAAVGALVLSVKPSMSTTALVSLLQQNSDDLGTPGFDPQFGWGRVNAYRAVNAAKNLSGDSTPPVVSISSPGAGATVSGAIPVQGTATDNVGVTKIDLLVDGLVVTSATSSPFSFSLNTTAYANGSHSLTVNAYDAASNRGSASVSVNVSNAPPTDTQPPTVSLTSPPNGSTVSGIVNINVAARDNVGVSQVSIYIDGILKYSGTTAPYTYSWNTKRVARGTHAIKATAWDAAGNAGYATPISVTR